MAVDLRGWWRQKREDLAMRQQESVMPSIFIPSVVEGKDSEANERLARAHFCTQEGVRAGVKAASIACVASAIPTLAAVRLFPWAKANVNYTGQALIVSAATIATYFIVTEQTILKCSRSASYAAVEKSRAGVY